MKSPGFLTDQRNCLTRFACPPGSAGPVNIIGVVTGNFVIDHQGYIFNVNSPGHYISGYQNLNLTTTSNVRGANNLASAITYLDVTIMGASSKAKRFLLLWFHSYLNQC